MYKRKNSYARHRKGISIREFSEDQECETRVRKSFIYLVHRVSGIDSSVTSPEIMTKKVVNTKLKYESFAFCVKGIFYLTQGRYIFKVEFRHALKIHIVWKKKIVSPQTSITFS
ncbi:MAG: hypothetical protein NUV91_02170, partial [Candidatus Omnitrophica bacterium]|nr:hypothetical protein [Candidatus Omnitrophota bacterium]